MIGARLGRPSPQSPSQFTEEQIIGFLKEADAGAQIAG